MTARRKKTDAPEAEKPRRRASRASGEGTPVSPGGPEAVEPPAAPACEPQPRQPDVSALGIGRIVVFTLDGQRYALPIERVQEIQQLVAFTDVPDPAPALVGMVNLRGLVVPLVDLRTLLGMESARYSLDTPMIICRARDALVALVVDEVDDVVAIPEGSLQEAPRVHALASRMLAVCRMEQDLVFLLDLDAVMPDLTIVAGEAS